MPDILFVPSTATQAEIVDLVDRLQLGDMLRLDGRVVSLIALSTAALSCGNSMSQDRRFFGIMDSLIRNSESPCSTPESAARYIVEQGIVPGQAEEDWKAQRLAKNYRKDRKLKRSR